ncbi:MAG TPA: MFS transporter [Solirubrobacteraceae bacterium]|nr:MFS transporter [Solirubrobacteraceae bacterium]
MFSGLFGFGVLNAILGPALPYLRAEEHLSYLSGELHQLAFAVGGGLAGLLAIRAEARLGRGATVRFGLAAAAVAGLAVGYGDEIAITVPGAFLMSLFGTSALVRMWAALADAHGPRRTVAMTEGEVPVSLGGTVVPLMVGGLAATVLTWRFAFVAGAAIVIATVLAMGAVRIPRSERVAAPDRQPRAAALPARSSPMPTLVIVVAIVALEFSLSFWLASYLNGSVGIGREDAVLMVSGLYGANLTGRLVASRLARRATTERVLGAALILALVGLPILLAARGAAVAALGIAVTGTAIGAMFPLTSSMHVGISSRNADGAIGQVQGIASIGQILGPFAVAAIAQAAGLRVGLFILPGLVLLAAAGLNGHHRQTQLSAGYMTGVSVRGRRGDLDSHPPDDWIASGVPDIHEPKA